MSGLFFWMLFSERMLDASDVYAESFGCAHGIFQTACVVGDTYAKRRYYTVVFIFATDSFGDIIRTASNMSWVHSASFSL